MGHPFAIQIAESTFLPVVAFICPKPQIGIFVRRPGPPISERLPRRRCRLARPQTVAYWSWNSVVRRRPDKSTVRRRCNESPGRRAATFCRRRTGWTYCQAVAHGSGKTQRSALAAVVLLDSRLSVKAPSSRPSSCKTRARRAPEERSPQGQRTSGNSGKIERLAPCGCGW